MSKILYLQYTNPAAYPPLEHSSQILAQRGWQVLFLGVGAFGNADLLSFPKHSNIVVRKLPFRARGWRLKFHYLCYCLWAFFWTLWWRPKWIYASDPLSCPAAILPSYLFGLKVLYHEHDSPAKTNKLSKWVKFVMGMRRNLARHAQLRVLPNEKRVEIFSSEMGNNRMTIPVWNCPTREEVSGPRRLCDDDESLWMIYHGSIVPGRLPMTLFEALAMLSYKLKLRIIGYETSGRAEYLKYLRILIGRSHLEQRVEIVGTLPTRSDIFKYCQLSDIGIALMPKNSKDINEQTMACASNKAFDYLASGLALLVSDLPDWTKMFVPNYGLACNPEDPDSIKKALHWFIEHPREMKEMGERGRQQILAEWNYEQKFQPVLNRLQE